MISSGPINSSVLFSEIAYTISSTRRSKPVIQLGNSESWSKKYLYGHQAKDVLKHSNALRDFYPNFNLLFCENLDKLQDLVLSREGAQNRMLTNDELNQQLSSKFPSDPRLGNNQQQSSPPLQSAHPTITRASVRSWISSTLLSYPRKTSR
jgi:hypothetical protein